MIRLKTTRSVALYISFIVLGVIFVCTALWLFYGSPLLSPAPDFALNQYHRTLDKYRFQQLRTAQFPEATIEVATASTVLANGVRSRLFTLVYRGHKVSGQMHEPIHFSSLKSFPVVILVRGYVDKETYYSGLGTRRSAEAFTDAGYLTFAPDFLGYGTSDPESNDIWEARFAKPETVLALLEAVQRFAGADKNRVAIWGHSNGGQIALSVLEITQKKYPTTLWAPVTQGFPESVTEYMDDLDDKGAYLMKELGKFRERYTDEDYSISAYVQDIEAPLQIHQGLGDEDVDPLRTASTAAQLKALGKTVTYFTYPGETHNFTQGSFSSMIQRDLAFFARSLK